eukprot:PhM_4_TR997/c0_g1_i1/m.68603
MSNDLIKIQGYSGCPIAVVRNPEEEGTYILEKSAVGAAAAGRLALQMSKQQSFALWNTVPDVFAPHLLYVRTTTQRPLCGLGDAADVDASDNKHFIQCATYGMHYEHHTDCLAFLNKCTVQNLRFFSRKLHDVLQQHIDHSLEGNGGQQGQVPKKVFADKYQDVLKNLAKQRDSDGSAVDADTYDWVRVNCDSLYADVDGTYTMPLGVCHGDLTLSNILVQQPQTKETTHRSSKNNTPMKSSGSSKQGPSSGANPGDTPALILIDFLDSFLETPLADAAKLRQDTLFGWTLRLVLDGENGRGTDSQKDQKQSLDVTRMRSSLRFLDKELTAFLDKFEWWREHKVKFMVLNQLRVLQYAKERKIVDHLVESVKQILENEI